MARLTDRPSIAYSRPSATPDPAFDQENMDPSRPRDKGKQRADHSSAESRLPTPSSRDDHSPARGQKRRRRAMPTNTNNNDMSGEAQYTKDYDPNQDPEERREVKRKQRELAEDFHANREELLRDDGLLLEETVGNADRVFAQVKNTSDAVPDARLLVSVGQLAYKKSAALVNGDNGLGLDVEDFFVKALALARGSGTATQRRQTTTNDSDDEADGQPLDWAYLGRHVCYPHTSRAPVPSFLLGPLSREKKQRAPTQRRARQVANNTHTARPEALTQVENEQAEQTSVVAQCDRLLKALRKHISRAKKAYRKEHDEAAFNRAEDLHIFTQRNVTLVNEEGTQYAGVPLFQWITNPHSFSQTVENLFYVSFLIKEGSAGLVFDDDGLPIIYPGQPHTIDEHRQQQITKQQAVLSLDHDTWQQLIDAYDIKEPMMEHRDDSAATQMANGWYAS